MKNLVLLYRSKKDTGVTIKEYSCTMENNKHYLFGKDYYGHALGILKKCVGEIRIFKDYFGGNATIYPVELPDMGDLKWHGGYFIFVNKNKYEENPLHYIDMIKNFRED